MSEGNSNFACKIRIRSQELVNHIPKLREVVCQAIRQHPVEVVEGRIVEVPEGGCVKVKVELHYVGAVDEDTLHRTIRQPLVYSAQRISRIAKRPVELHEVRVHRLAA